MRVCLGLISHHASADCNRLWPQGVQAQDLEAFWEVPCCPKGYIAAALGVQALELMPPLAMVCLAEGVKCHLEAWQAL